MADTKDLRSKYVLKFEQQGVEKVQKVVDALRESMSPESMAEGMSELDKKTARTMKQMTGLSKSISQVNKALQGMTKMGREMEKLAKSMKEIRGGGRGGAPETGGAPGGPAGGPRGGFMQGVLQGGGFGPFLQRGPGMYRQAAGMAVGRMGRGIGGGLMSMPFQGIGGVGQGLASIPGGGLIGGALSNAAGMSSDAIQRQQALLGFGGRDRASQAAVRARAARIQAFERGIDAAGQQAGARADMLNQAELSSALEREPQAGWWSRNMFGEGNASMLRERRVRERMSSGARSRRASMIEEARRRARAAGPNLGPATDPMSLFQNARRGLTTMTGTQGLQFATQMGLSGMDGTFTAAQQGGGLRGALAGQTLGIGNAQTLGAFTRAQRRGGIVGAGRQGAGIADAIEGALRAGFDRSEANQFLAQIAQAQQRFVQTGMPINPQSILGMARGVTGAFTAGARSNAFASAIANAAQGVAQTGPQSAEQFALLQTMGGFRGGGLQGLEEAQSRLESGQFGSQELNQLVNQASRRAGGGVAGRFGIRGLFRSLGANVSISEARRLQRIAGGGPLSAADREFRDAQLAQLQGAAGDPQAALEGRARGVVGQVGGLQNQASLQDFRVTVGQKLLPAIQKFEKATTTTASAFGELAPTLTKFADGAVAMADNIPKFASAMQNFIDWWATRGTAPNAGGT